MLCENYSAVILGCGINLSGTLFRMYIHCILCMIYGIVVLFETVA